ncbi:MAG: FAD-dependent oxidoreductase [Bacteroidales bacterium]|nr:FAD-dependent oxidoreductase [Lentimicrobiaceae bacterium]MDD5693801.1 FAD-dependent oxidoreductase [Bacteroidales bacterium]
MKRFSSVENFVEFRKIILKEVKDGKPCLAICAGTGGQASGSNDIIRIIKRYIIENNLNEKISLRITGCLGFCEMDPFIIVEPGFNLYPKLKMEDVPKIIDAAVEGRIIEEKLYKEPGGEKHYFSQSDIPFYKNQTRTILGYNQKIDPIRIFNYIQNGGYGAFEKVISHPDPEWIIKEVIDSGLRGRGGGGFPTGLKWKFARQSGKPGIQKFIVCNGDEGDPGAFMDEGVLEGNPHLVIEGMIIAGIAIGTTRGIIYVRTEYPLAIKHLIIAINQALDLGILGKNILGSSIDFDIEIIKGAGAFVCGEETALIKSIEGKMGQPKQRPPYPVNKGLWGFPTCINNVETLANVPVIINHGAIEYVKVGTPGNTGTKIFSLVGKIKNTGLVEVPLGTTIKDVVYKIGGGSPGKAKIKAIQTGGPSGGCIPDKMFDLPIDYESLTKAGSIMGSGGMIVMDEDTCMVDVARYFTNFLQEESCGKCSTCREGTKRMNEILTSITEGKGKMEDIDLLKELGPIIKDASMCGLGQTAANPLLATLRYFENEYLDHVEKKKCTAGVCKEIISSPCQYNCPIDTEACVYIALIAHGRYEEALDMIKKDNPLSSVLARVCHHPCESKCKAGEYGEPVAIKNLKRFVTDYGLENNLITQVKEAKKKEGDKVAIIGSGPAGLTCGFYLALKGYDVTLFEKQSVIGGMMMLGIPEYRLPRQIVQADIDYIKSSGIEIITNTALGTDFTLDDLFRKGFKAVFIATGANVSLKLDIAGENIKGVIPGMEALTNLNLNKNIDLGKRVGIIGGGNSAVDAARSALRAETSESILTVDMARSALRTTKPEHVTIFYRRSLSEIPAYKEEVEGAMEEGIEFEFLTAPVRIISDQGKLIACEFVRMKLGEVDESGRRVPIPIEDSEFIVKLDTLIVSISEKPDVSFLREEGLEITKWSTLSINNETMETNIKGVFAGGDIVSGPNSVVAAVSAGKIAAESIDQYVQGKEVKRQYRITRPSTYVEPLLLSDAELDELLTSKRVEMPLLSPEKRKYNLMEVEQGYTEEQAKMEAMRCLRCELETKDGQAFLEKIKVPAQS